MHIYPDSHLTYCTNIHPGESWLEVFESLRHTLTVKRKLKGRGAFGIGLRLSAKAASELARTRVLESFREWLQDNDCYVFTLNGFPYGEFHGEVVKGKVHEPDWTTRKRVTYTKLLFDLLAELLPEGMGGGVSTSPLSYRPWFPSSAEAKHAMQTATLNLMEVVLHLVKLKERTGKSLHLDVEPEPDGLLDNSRDFVTFFQGEVMTAGLDWLHHHLRTTRAAAEAAIREHLAYCWDICHVAVAYEQPAEVLHSMEGAGIRIGKLQISAALKAGLGENRREVFDALLPYKEPIYLHQAALLDRDGGITRLPDLGPALEEIEHPRYKEIRTHFHVPIYTDSYGILESTNSTIADTLKLWEARPFTNHLEVETYTWDVLPDHQRLDLTDSITRELNWVLGVLDIEGEHPEGGRSPVFKSTTDASGT